MRDIYPVKFYSDEGFVEYKLEINDEDLDEIIGDYLSRHAKFDFDELEVVKQGFEAGRLGADVKVKGPYDGNPTGG